MRYDIEEASNINIIIIIPKKVKVKEVKVVVNIWAQDIQRSWRAPRQYNVHHTETSVREGTKIIIEVTETFNDKKVRYK